MWVRVPPEVLILYLKFKKIFDIIFIMKKGKRGIVDDYKRTEISIYEK